MPGLYMQTITDEITIMQYMSPTYDNFIGFVKEFLAPHMKSPFIEEAYYRQLWDESWNNRFTDAQISRGHSKSEFSIWRNIYLGVTQPYNPHFFQEKGQQKQMKEGLIICSDGTMVNEKADRIKYYFRADDRLAGLLPENAEEELPDNTKKMMLRNGTTYLFRSIKTKRGLHPDWIDADDLTTENSTLTDKQTWDLWTGAILPMSTANVAPVTIFGTPIRNSDIMSRIRYGVEEGETNPWHHIFLPAYNRETGALLSPGRFTKAMLDRIKAMIGSRKFEAEYMLNPVDDETSIIKREWVEACFDKNHGFVFNRAEYDEVFLGWDFAFSDRVTADNAVGVIIGRKTGKLWVINIHVYKGLSGLEQLDKVKELHARYRFDRIGLEENSITAIQKEATRISIGDGSILPVKLFRLTNHDGTQDALSRPGEIVNVGKQQFIMRLATLFENREIVLPYKGMIEKNLTDQLTGECTSWALEEGKLVEIGPHPDIPVALGYAVEVARMGSFVILF